MRFLEGIEGNKKSTKFIELDGFLGLKVNEEERVFLIFEFTIHDPH